MVEQKFRGTSIQSLSSIRKLSASESRVGGVALWQVLSGGGGGGRDRAFAGGWRDSDGGATDRHYSTIHSVAQSYVTKAFHLQAHCGNPGDINCRGSLPLSATETDLSTPLSPPSRSVAKALHPTRRQRRGGGHVRLFPCVLRIPLPCGGSVLLRFQPTLPLSERGSCA